MQSPGYVKSPKFPGGIAPQATFQSNEAWVSPVPLVTDHSIQLELDRPINVKRLDTLLLRLTELREHIDERLSTQKAQIDELARSNRARHEEILVDNRNRHEENARHFEQVRRACKTAQDSLLSRVSSAPRMRDISPRATGIHGVHDSDHKTNAFGVISDVEKMSGGSPQNEQQRLHMPVGMEVSSKIVPVDTDLDVASNEAAIPEKEQDLAATSTTQGKSAKPAGRSRGKKDEKDDEAWVDGESVVELVLRRYCDFVRSHNFDYMMGGVIILNTVFIGLEVNSKAKNPGMPESERRSNGFSILETVFFILFAIELICRLSVYRKTFPFSAWNLFDSFIVFSGMIEECMKYGVGGSTLLAKLSVFRMVRILKIVRALRIIRVLRAFRELRVVMYSMISAFRSLFWTLLLMFVLIYLIAILILVELANSADSFSESTTYGEFRKTHFFGIGRSLLTLFQCTTGGMDWTLAWRALVEIIPWVSVLWVFYISFVLFAIHNTVTGIFVDQALKSSADDEMVTMMEESDLRESMIHQLRSLFLKADSEVDSSGIINDEKLKYVCKEMKKAKEFKVLGLEECEIVDFFDLVADEQGTIPISSIDDFVRGCFRVKGTARSVDLIALMYKLSLTPQKK